MSSADSEGRLGELEVHVAHLDTEVNSLDQALVGQQRDVETMKKRIQALENRLDNLIKALRDAQSRGADGG
jgi:uncharacterized coiled-coil protein SlyX